MTSVIGENYLHQASKSIFLGVNHSCHLDIKNKLHELTVLKIHESEEKFDGEH